MCNLYSMTKNVEAIRRLFSISSNRAAAIEPSTAIFPGHSAGVIRISHDGERELVPMSWGIVLPQAGKAPKRVTNTRDDTALHSRFWQASFRSRRCLVPATSFCEPHGSRTPATWHWFAIAGSEPRPLFAFAGLWKRHQGPIRKNGPDVEVDVFSFMTTEPNTLTITVNHERSPVLLTTPEDWEAWLEAPPQDAFKLARPIASEKLRIVQEGFEKQDAGC